MSRHWPGPSGPTILNGWEGGLLAVPAVWWSSLVRGGAGGMDVRVATGIDVLLVTDEGIDQHPVEDLAAPAGP